MTINKLLHCKNIGYSNTPNNSFSLQDGLRCHEYLSPYDAEDSPFIAFEELSYNLDGDCTESIYYI